MRNLFGGLFFVGLMLLSAVASAGQMPGVDWKSESISAVGTGVPPDGVTQAGRARALACRAAKLDALRNLLETTQGVRVDSSTLVKDAMVESDLIRSTVEGIVKGAYVSDQRLMSDGSCEVTATMPMAGDLFAAVISEKKFRQQTADAQVSSLSFPDRMKRLARRLAGFGLIRRAYAGEVPQVVIENAAQLKLAEQLQKVFESQGDKVASAIIGHAINDYQQERDFTGIVIDASSVQAFHPAELPWIRGVNGDKLYPNAKTPYEVVKSAMPVSYDFDVSDAVKNRRVATKPLVVKAVSTYKQRDSDLVLDQAGQKRFKDLIRKGYVNEKARIMIVVAE